MHNPILPQTHENVTTFRPTVKVSDKFNRTTIKTTRARDEMIQKLGKGVFGEEYQKKKKAEKPYRSGVK